MRALRVHPLPEPEDRCGRGVHRDDRILIAKRAIEPRKGSWTLPAATWSWARPRSRRPSARPGRACATIEIDRLLAMYSVARIGQVQIMYRARLVSPDVAAGPESEEVALVDLADIPWDSSPSRPWSGRSPISTTCAARRTFATYSNPTGDLAKMWPPRKPAGL